MGAEAINAMPSASPFFPSHLSKRRLVNANPAFCERKIQGRGGGGRRVVIEKKPVGIKNGQEVNACRHARPEQKQVADSKGKRGHKKTNVEQSLNTECRKHRESYVGKWCSRKLCQSFPLNLNPKNPLDAASRGTTEGQSFSQKQETREVGKGLWGGKRTPRMPGKTLKTSLAR